MRLQDDIDFTTLTWVKAELDETLNQARNALEAYVEDPSDASQIRFCATYLHQVQGTLRMVELYGAAMATEEMEQLATALLGSHIEDRDEAYAVLMRGIVQLPDYLERLQTGYKDIPIVLLPLLNDLRAARGEKSLSEAVLFSPDLSRTLPAAASGPAQPVPDADLRRQAAVLRSQFQLSLLRWFRGEDATAHGQRLAQVCERLVGLVTQEDARRLFWVSGALLEALNVGAFEPSPPLKQAIGRVEREVKRLADAGEASFRLDPPRELTRSLLYFVAHAPTDHARLVEMRRIFDLASLMPSEQELEHARGSISGHNRALLDTVAGAIKEDLLRVKDALDLFIRAQAGDISTLGSQAEVLTRVADTLGMLGLGVPRRVVLDQRDIVVQLSAGKRQVEDGTFLDIAGALLYVEASLDDQVQHLGSAGSGNDAEAAPGLPQADARRVLETLVKEAQANFAQAKHCFVAFVESNWDHAQLQDVPRLLDEVAGALRILELDEAPRYLVAARDFTERELLKHNRVPNGQQMDTLADVLASLEYYLEALREHRPGRDRIVEVARQRLESLGYWPLPMDEDVVAELTSHTAVAAVEATVAPREAAPVAAPSSAETQPMPAVVVEQPVPADEVVARADAAGARAEATLAPDPGMQLGGLGFEGGGEEIDDEIREVFIEEVQEEIANLDDLLPRWTSNPESVEMLKPIRRVFHTLKGSGRLVGALALGEFSWKVESMLNRVLDQSITASPAVVALVQAAHGALPQLLGALRGESPATDDLDDIMQVADALSAGEDAWIGRRTAAPATSFEIEAEIVDAAETADADDAAFEAVTAETDLSEEATLAAAEADGGFELDAASLADLQAELARAAGTMPEACSDDAGGAASAALEKADLEDAATYAGDIEGATVAAGSVEHDDVDVISLDDQSIHIADASDAHATGDFVDEAQYAVEAADRLLIGARTPFSIDPVLFDILKAEVAGHLETIEDYLSASAEHSRPVTDPLLRAVHTMAGAFAMTEVPHIGDVVNPCESYIKRLLARNEAPSVEGLALLGDAVGAIRTLMHALDLSQPYAPEFPVLAEQLAAVRDLLPEPTGPLLPMHIEPEVVAPAAFATDVAIVSEAAETTETEASIDAWEADKSETRSEDATFVGGSVKADELVANWPRAERPPIVDFHEAIDPAIPEADAHEAVDADDATAAFIDPDGHVETAAVALDDAATQNDSRAPAGADEEAAFAFEESAETGAVSQADDDVSARLAESDTAAAPETTAPARDAPAAEEHAVDASAIAGDVGTDASDLPASDAVVLDEPAVPANEDATELEFELEEFELADDALVLADAADIRLDDGVEDDLEDAFELMDRDEPEAMAAVDFGPGPVAPGAEAMDALSRDPLADAIDAALHDIEDHTRADDQLASHAEMEVTEHGASFTGVTAEDALEADDMANLLGDEEPSSTLDALSLDDELDAIELRTDIAFEAREIDSERDAEVGAQHDAVVDAQTDEEIEALASSAPDAQADAESEAQASLEADAFDEAGQEDFASDAAVGEEQELVLPALSAELDPDPDGPLQLADVDEELLDIFLEEGVDILDHSDSLLARLREDTSDRELVVGLQRDLHTLKGGARMAGITPIGDLGHAMESLLEAVAEGRRELRREGIEVLERSFDRLHRMVTRVGERRALAMPLTLVACVDALVRGEALPLLGSTDATADGASIPTASALARVSIPTQFDEAEEEESSVRAPQEQIRIRADLLDRLVNYAGEVAIYRARLEQQLGAFRGGLSEMEQTTARLREQLRRLEIETEAQILSRYQRAGEDGVEQEFDPLELDRFSTLQQLSRALSESAADLTNLQGTLDDLTRQYETLLLQQSRVSSELQEGLMRTRMLPFDALVPRLRRILRQTSSELGKKAKLRVEGAQGEMDRNVLDRMTAPLEHILRNAIAHGMESPEERIALGKREEGTVRFIVSREGSEVVIRALDDGRGLDRDAIRNKAIDRGLMDPDAQLSDRDLYGFILESGFSTAATVSKIAGRGVGMDVVNSEIKQLGGSLHIESEFGKGTEFVIRLPFTMAVTQAVFVKITETQFAVPIASVQGVARISPADLQKQLDSGHPHFEYAGEQYAIYDLGLLLGQAHVRATESLQVPLLLARSGDQRAAICVDQVIGSREIVVKPTGPQINSIPGIFGATVMGDGGVVVILDVAPLVRRAAALRLTGDAPVIVAEVEHRQVPLVMVVDDSITMRKVTGRVLERSGYEVMTAKDGIDALERLNERVPDVMLLDIEMPRMDGYELATHIRNDVRLRGIPIIMVTSRTGEKHRQRAFEIGVDRYLGKPYQEAELMRNVQEILKVGRGEH
jgi:chemosensory pili system protein ChpA (sensor histidine kinase/response regulator)